MGISNHPISVSDSFYGYFNPPFLGQCSVFFYLFVRFFSLEIISPATRTKGNLSCPATSTKDGNGNF